MIEFPARRRSMIIPHWHQKFRKCKKADELGATNDTRQIGQQEWKKSENRFSELARIFPVHRWARQPAREWVAHVKIMDSSFAQPSVECLARACILMTEQEGPIS